MANFSFWLSGFPAPTSCPWPLMPSARRPDVVGPFTAAFSQRGIVSDWPFAGKRKVCEDFGRHTH